MPAMRRNRPAQYETEAQLCATFMHWAKNQGWTSYAETEGWDILLVAPDGTQIGVQAKMKFNMKVIIQAIPNRWDAWKKHGPDFRSLLLPMHDGDADNVCGALGLVAFYPSYPKECFSPSLDASNERLWHFWNPEQRHPLPEFVPDVAAGVSSPVQLTKWKIGALRITAVLNLRGYVTREDFRRYGIDPRRWIGPGGWLDFGKEKGVYVRGESLKFDTQHPTVFQQVLEEVKKEPEFQSRLNLESGDFPGPAEKISSNQQEQIK
jgi:hypothetical protein